MAVLVQIAIAHARLETIHPFVDGNGRNGRALVHALLRGKGVVRSTTAPLSEGLPKNTNRYFGALRSYRAGGAGPICEQFAVASRFAAHSDAGLIDKPGLEPDAARGRLPACVHGPWGGRCRRIWSPILSWTPSCSPGCWGHRKPAPLRALARLQDAGVVVERS